MPKTKLTKSEVDRISPPRAGQVLYYDTVLAGFGLRVGRQAKTYFAERRVLGRTKRVTIGRHGHFTCEQARQRAQTILNQLANGRDPAAEKKEKLARGITVEEAFTEFKRLRTLAPRTAYNYERFLEVAFGDWKSRPLSSISNDSVVERHVQLTNERGGPYADHAMRFLRSLWNFASARYENAEGKSLIAQNPVARLSRLRLWHKARRRQTYVSRSQLPAWFAAVNRLADGEQGKTARDYLILLLLTGLRRSEAARLEWVDVDLERSTLTVRQTKNDNTLVIPLSGQLHTLLSERAALATASFVFPGGGAAGHLVDAKKSMRKVAVWSGVAFTLHDLRRTFITAAESLDVSAYALKRLVNHSLSGDVTAGYIVHDVERLRAPMQQISDFLCAAQEIAVDCTPVSSGGEPSQLG